MQGLQNKRVLVTGAGGFIGSHVVEALVPICEQVTAMIHYDSRPDWGNLEFLPADYKSAILVESGDVTDPFFVQRMAAKQDVILHLAALISIPHSYRGPDTFFRTNVLGTVNVLEAARFCDVERVVVTSTSETYGTAQTVPMNESHPLQAQSPYSASKIGADKAAESYYCSFELPVVILRPFNTYGPRQSARAVIPTIISQAVSDKPDIYLGALSPVRDLTYVSDTVRGFLAAATAENAIGETINLGVGKGVTIGELAEKLLQILGSDKLIRSEEQRIRPEKSEVMELISDNSNAKKLLGWSPLVSLEEGLHHTVEFIRQHSNIYKTERYTV